MDLSSRHAPPSRPSPLGLGLVVGVHLVVFWALGSAFIKQGHPASPPVQARVIEQPLPPQDPPPPLPADQPQLKPIEVPVWTPPVIVDLAPPDERPSLSTRTGEPPAATDHPAVVATGGTTAPSGTTGTARPEAAGAVCTVMPRPEVPAVAWSGEALLHVTATVKAGRVVTSEIQFTRSGLDSRTRRSLQHSVESALAGYQCPGEHVFEQDFAFRLD
jgi:hypothetical protein